MRIEVSYSLPTLQRRRSRDQQTFGLGRWNGTEKDPIIFSAGMSISIRKGATTVSEWSAEVILMQCRANPQTS